MKWPQWSEDASNETPARRLCKKAAVLLQWFDDTKGAKDRLELIVEWYRKHNIEIPKSRDGEDNLEDLLRVLRSAKTASDKRRVERSGKTIVAGNLRDLSRIAQKDLHLKGHEPFFDWVFAWHLMENARRRLEALYTDSGYRTFYKAFESAKDLGGNLQGYQDTAREDYGLPYPVDPRLFKDPDEETVAKIALLADPAPYRLEPNAVNLNRSLPDDNEIIMQHGPGGESGTSPGYLQHRRILISMPVYFPEEIEDHVARQVLDFAKRTRKALRTANDMLKTNRPWPIESDYIVKWTYRKPRNFARMVAAARAELLDFSSTNAPGPEMEEGRAPQLDRISLDSTTDQEGQEAVDLEAYRATRPDRNEDNKPELDADEARAAVRVLVECMKAEGYGDTDTARLARTFHERLTDD